MYGYIYLTTNLINNKKYIGQHKSEFFDLNYKGSGKILRQAFLKDGFNNFKCEILKDCKSKAELDYYEAYFIDKFDCVNSSEYYNLKPGGSGKSVKGLIYIRNIKTGKCKKVTENDLQNYLDSGDYVIGGPIPSKEIVAKRAQRNTGKRRSSEQKNNISKALKGKVLSAEHKKNLRKPKKVPPFNAGKICVHKDDYYLFINPSDLDDYLSDGYLVGGKSKVSTHSANVSKAKRGKIKIIHSQTGQIKYIDKEKLEEFKLLGFYSNKYN